LLINEAIRLIDDLFTGNLALSRALGDFEFKQNYGLEPEKQIVTADPDILTHKVDGEEEFLVLACDGEPVTIGLTRESPTLTVSCYRYLGLPLFPASRRLYPSRCRQR
jgi:hypothetical protein